MSKYISDPLGNKGVLLEKGSADSLVFIIKRDNVLEKDSKVYLVHAAGKACLTQKLWG
jgi:hypothetical protein